jgi:phage terminase large subunit-like protein
VSALYEQGVVSHVGHFEKLEREMTTYQGAIGEDSPNRMDALVWALTELNGGSMVECADFSGGGTSFDSEAF